MPISLYATLVVCIAEVDDEQECRLLLQNRDSVRDDTVQYNFYDKITVYGYGELSKLLIRAFELYRCYTTPNQQVAPKHQYCERN